MNQQPSTQDYLMQQREKVAASPDCAITRYNYAVALLAQNRFEEAEKELLEAVSCSPSLAEAFVLLGGIRMHFNDINGCLEYNKRATQARPRFAEGYGNIGFAHLQLGNVDEAITALEKAVSFNPKFLQAYTNLGNAYLMKGMVDKSIETNYKVLEMEPAFAVAHNNLTIAFLEKGDKVKAAEHCRQAESMGFEVAPQIKKEIGENR
jgi:tetratricopeptide (TPR) repeat protein